MSEQGPERGHAVTHYTLQLIYSSPALELCAASCFHGILISVVSVVNLGEKRSDWIGDCGFAWLVFIGSTSERKPKIACKLGLGMAYVRSDRRRRQLLDSLYFTATNSN